MEALDQWNYTTVKPRLIRLAEGTMDSSMRAGFPKHKPLALPSLIGTMGMPGNGTAPTRLKGPEKGEAQMTLLTLVLKQ